MNCLIHINLITLYIKSSENQFMELLVNILQVTSALLIFSIIISLHPNIELTLVNELNDNKMKIININSEFQKYLPFAWHVKSYPCQYGSESVYFSIRGY